MLSSDVNDEYVSTMFKEIKIRTGWDKNYDVTNVTLTYVKIPAVKTYYVRLPTIKNYKQIKHTVDLIILITVIKR